MARDALNDVLIDCRRTGENALIVYLSVGSNLLGFTYTLADGELVVDCTMFGEAPRSFLHDLSTLQDLSVLFTLSATVITNTKRSNWVGWSKIGQASFVMDVSNDAGFKQMEWPGYVYDVRKLGDSVVIYGSNGISLALPVSSPAPTFGFKELYRGGIKSKLSVAGDEFVHYFVDKIGCLYQVNVDKGVQKLGYEEFLSTMTTPVLLWDSMLSRLYISDSETGYTFNGGALGGGYKNITGVARVENSTISFVSPEDIELDGIGICTDTIDFGSRGMKIVDSVQYGIDTDSRVYAAIDYRYSTDESFKTTKWVRLNREGIAHIRVSGTDFRFRLRSDSHIFAELSYISIQLVSNDHRYRHGEVQGVSAITA